MKKSQLKQLIKKVIKEEYDPESELYTVYSCQDGEWNYPDEIEFEDARDLAKQLHLTGIYDIRKFKRAIKQKTAKIFVVVDPYRNELSNGKVRDLMWSHSKNKLYKEYGDKAMEI